MGASIPSLSKLDSLTGKPLKTYRASMEKSRIRHVRLLIEVKTGDPLPDMQMRRSWSSNLLYTSGDLFSVHTATHLDMTKRCVGKLLI